MRHDTIILLVEFMAIKFSFCFFFFFDFLIFDFGDETKKRQHLKLKILVLTFVEFEPRAANVNYLVDYRKQKKT